MSAKISKELSQQLKAAGDASEKELPVIITVEDSSKLDALKEQGFVVAHTFDIINAVSGTLPAAAVKSIARLDQVQHIDYDGVVEALKPIDDDDE
jgi:hypothetical protein